MCGAGVQVMNNMWRGWYVDLVVNSGDSGV